MLMPKDTCNPTRYLCRLWIAGRLARIIAELVKHRLQLEGMKKEGGQPFGLAPFSGRF